MLDKILDRLGGDVSSERVVNQIFALVAEQFGGGQVQVQDDVAVIKNKVSHWREVVQVRILLVFHAQLLMGLAQFFVLHFQFDLMHL